MARSLYQLFFAMGGSVSPGRNNDELVNHLIDAEFIRTPAVQRVFRSVDRANYVDKDHRNSAYKDIAWKLQDLHISAPCVYSVVLESLELKPKLSFLNLGSGSGYLSTMAGLLLGQYGINHGIELHQKNVNYAYERLEAFLKEAKAIDENDFCEPEFTCGNCLTFDSNVQLYDRVYCGAACPEEYETYVKNLVKVNGILVIPLKDKLLKMTRIGENTWTSVKLLSVSFTELILPPTAEKGKDVKHAELGEITPPTLQQICRFNIRSKLRQNVEIENPNLKVFLIRNTSRPMRQMQRIVIPFTDGNSMAVDSSSDSDSDSSDTDSDSSEYGIGPATPTRLSLFLEEFLRQAERLQAQLRSSETREQFSSIKEENSNDSENNEGTSGTSPAKLISFVPIANAELQTSSEESDTNFNRSPSQSTRSQARKSLKRKRESSFSFPRPSSLTSTFSTYTETPAIWKRARKENFEKSPLAKEGDEVDPNFTYTNKLIPKIKALPLPLVLRKYINYGRNNL